MDRAAGQSAIVASVQPQGEASSIRSEHNVPKSASGAPSPRSPVKHDNSNKHTASASVVNTAQPNGMNAQTSTSSGAATPNWSNASPSRGPSTSAASAPKSAPMAKKPSGSAQKRSESRSGKPANRPKDPARPEQEDKSGNTTRTGGGHSAKEKGKATAYNPRVDPAVLNLVKANFALYNAEAMVDKYRVETFELEKAIGVPTKDMALEDQLQYRQLMTEFGQHRDAAKRERDTVIISFEKALHPYLSKYMDGMLKDMLAAHLAKAKPKAQEVRMHDAASAAVATSNQMETGGLEPPPSAHSAVETETKSLSQSATVIQDGPLPQHGAAAGSSNGLNGETLQTEGTAEKSVDQVAEVNKVDAALNTVETSAPMEVDVDKPDRPLAIEPVVTSRHLQELDLPHPSPAHAALPNGTPVSLADGPTGSKQDRRKLVGERLKVLEDGLRSTCTTTHELGIKLEKLEEQIASQEEQLYEYLNTQALDNEIRPEDATTPSVSAERPSDVTAKEVTVEAPVSASKTDQAVLETARAALDMRLEELARLQETQMAVMAQANEVRLSTLRNEIRAEISVEAARAEEAYASAIQSAEAKAAKLEIQLASLQAELMSFKEERKAIEELKVQQQASDQLLKTIRESTLKAQLTENQNRTSFNTKFGEIETRLDSHDSQLRNIRTFEQTKEAWRNDIIDMKNHVIGRVDYLEETIEGTRTPEVTARTNDQPTQPSTAPRPENQSALQSTGENSAVGLQARPLKQSVNRPIQSAQSQIRALQPQFSPVPTTQQSAMHERSQYPTQSSLTSSADTSQARLAINRGTGPSPLNSAPVTQAATASGHSAFQSSAGSLSGHTAGQQNLSATANHGFGQSWQPALSMQQPQGQPRLSPLHFDNEQGIYPLRSMPGAARTGSSGSPVPHVNPASEGSLSSRLNGGDMRSQVPRPDSTAASTLPLVMRMHNGNGLPNSHNWMQSNNQTNPAGVNPNEGSAQQSLNEGASSGRLRIYAPGDTKPPQL